MTGPSFDLVAGWAGQGVPLKVALRGIDRYFERYYRKGPRRRPVHIDFCEADVLDVFDEWRRAVGLTKASHATADLPGGEEEGVRRSSSLPAHLERVVLRLTAARAAGRLGNSFDDMIDRVARELDSARGDVRGLRGEARRALLERLRVLDAELIESAAATLDATSRATLTREAEDELSGFRERMTAESFARARDAALARLVRERFALPTVTFN